MKKTTRSLSLLFILGAGVTLILGSASNPVSPVSTISDADFKRYSSSGECSIKGQAFLKTRGGDVKYGAGEEVILLPDIPLLNEVSRINSNPGQHATLSPEISSKLQQMKRQTKAGGEGDFEFNGIPCGSWFVQSSVTWEVYKGGTQGGTVSARVKVDPQNSPLRVILNE